MIDRGSGFDPICRQCRYAVADNTFRIRTVERQTGEELRGHTAAAAAVVMIAPAAGARRLRLAQLPEQR